MTTIYVYVMDTMADWEIGYCLAELHSKRFFSENSSSFKRDGQIYGRSYDCSGYDDKRCSGK